MMANAIHQKYSQAERASKQEAKKLEELLEANIQTSDYKSQTDVTVPNMNLETGNIDTTPLKDEKSGSEACEINVPRANTEQSMEQSSE